MKIQDLKFDKHNFNLHTADGMELLAKSVKENGFGRSVLVDKDGNLIAGNGIVETAIKQGKTKIKVVETEGEELVVVKRTDLDINTEQGRRMALADNATAHLNLKWNEDELKAAKEAWNLAVEEWNSSNADWGGRNKEKKDLSDNAEISYIVEICCNSEEQQEELYNEITKKGIKCRILTL